MSSNFVAAFVWHNSQIIAKKSELRIGNRT
jgi:hypothetical protein